MEKKDIATEAWLNSQKKSTCSVYKSLWKMFLEFAKMTGDEILASRRDDKDFYWESKVLEFKAYLQNEKKTSSFTARAAGTTCRSFFTFHRKPLDFRRGEKAKLTEATRLREDYKFSIDDFAKMFSVADLEEKYVLTAGKSFGLRAGDFLRLTRGDLEPYIDREVPISIGEYNTEKEGVKAFPHIDADAQPVIKLMLEKLTREGRTGQDERILTFGNEIQLSRVLKRITENAGLNVGNKQVRFHCLRKFLIDHLSSYMSESKWKQIVGKKITEGAYVSSDSLREDYKRVMAETTFKKAAEIEGRLAELEKFKAGLSPEQLETARRLDIQMRSKSTRTKSKDEDCEDGTHCQQIVSEENLARYLSEGWKVVATLPVGIDRYRQELRFYFSSQHAALGFPSSLGYPIHY